MNRRNMVTHLARACAVGVPLFSVPLVGCGGGSGPSAAEPPLNALAPSTGWAAVVDAMVGVLQTQHIQPWGRVSQAVFLDQANALKSRINSLPAQLAAAEVMALIAMVGDGHTNVSTWALHKWLGVGLVEFSDGIFIASTTAATQSLMGAQVLRIGGLSAAQALKAAAKLWPAENPSAELAWGQWLATSINVLRLIGATSNLTEVSLTVRKPGATASEVVALPADESSRIGPDFNPSAVALRHREYQQSGTPYWSEWIEASRSMYFRYRDCRDAPRFAAFSDQLFNRLDALPVRRLVVDLRGNRGGDSGVLQPFLQGLAARASRTSAEQAGALCFITDRYSFSAAVDASLDLLRASAVHIGEAPGQSPNFLGNVTTRALTSLNVGMQYPTRISNRVPGNPASITPAVHVVRSSSDFFEGRDPALARAVE